MAPRLYEPRRRCQSPAVPAQRGYAEKTMQMSATVSYLLCRQDTNPTKARFPMVSTSFDKSGASALGAHAAHFAARIIDGLNGVMQLRARSAELRQLSELSDAQLAERGLQRDEIVAHVFRDRLAG